MKKPEFLTSDYGKFDRPAQLNLGFQALHAFVEKHGSLPPPHSDVDAEEVLRLTNDLNEQCEEKV